MSPANRHCYRQCYCKLAPQQRPNEKKASGMWDDMHDRMFCFVTLYAVCRCATLRIIVIRFLSALQVGVGETTQMICTLQSNIVRQPLQKPGQNTDPRAAVGPLVAETPLHVEKMPCKASLRIPVLCSWRMAQLRFLRKQDGSSANSPPQTPPPSASHDHFRFHRHHQHQQCHQIHPKAQFPTLISGFVACVCLAPLRRRTRLCAGKKRQQKTWVNRSILHEPALQGPHCHANTLLFILRFLGFVFCFL